MAKYDFLQTKMDFDGFDLCSYAQILCLFVTDTRTDGHTDTQIEVHIDRGLIFSPLPNMENEKLSTCHETNYELYGP